MSQVQLITIANPFDPHGSCVARPLIYAPGMTVRDCAARAFPIRKDFDIAIGRNGVVLESHEQDQLVEPGDSVSVCAVIGDSGGGASGKNIARAVAMIAIMVAAPYGAAAIGSMLPGGVLTASGIAGTATGFAALTFTGQAISMGLTVAGMMLVSAVLPPAMPDAPALAGTSDYSKNSPTYGWDTSGTNQEAENIALPTFYGYCKKIKPPRIARWIETIGDIQYLNLLYAIAGHATDGYGDVQINDTPYQVFSSVSIDSRPGFDTQGACEWFKSIITDKGVQQKINVGAYTSSQGEATIADELRVNLVFPNGIYFLNDSGAIGSITVPLTIVVQGAGYYVVRSVGVVAGQNSTKRHCEAFCVSGYIGPWTVSVQMDSQPGISDPYADRYVFECWFDYIQEVLNQPFTYPGVSLLAVRILATDKLSGAIPTVTCAAWRYNVQVYAPGVGYQNKPARVAAWQDYDILHNEESGDVPYSRINYDLFAEWAAWIEANGLYSDIYFDTIINTEQACNLASTIARGRVVQRGSQFIPIWDRPRDPVQMFTVGNTSQGTFEEVFLDLSARANHIEVTYNDADRTAKKYTMLLKSPLYTEGDEIRLATVSIPGEVSRENASRHGYFLLAQNDYLQRVVKKGVDIDAIAAQVTDVVWLQDDVPQWGFGGRIVSATASQVVLDQQVTIEAGTTYRIMIRSSADDSIQTVTITNTPGTTVTLLGSFSPVPVQYDLYTFGEAGIEAKKFSIQAISKTGKLQGTLTLLEYYDEVYEVPCSAPAIVNESALFLVKGLLAQSVWAFDSFGNIDSSVVLTWRGNSLSWNVYQQDGATWKLIGTAFEPKWTVNNLTPGATYTFAVGSIDSANRVTVTTCASIAAPVGVSVTEEIYETSGAGLKLKATVGWSDLSPFRKWAVRYKPSGGEYIYVGETEGKFMPIYDMAEGVYVFEVMAIDTKTGARSDWNPTTQELFGERAKPAALTGFVVQIVNNQAHLSWNQSTDADVRVDGQIVIKHSSVNPGAMWSGAIKIGPSVAGNATQAVVPALAGTYLIKPVDRGGREAEDATTITTDAPSLMALNIYDCWVEDPGFSGTKTGMIAIDNILKLDSTILFDDRTGMVDDWEYWDTEYDLNTHGEYLLEEIDLGAVYTSRITMDLIFSTDVVTELFDSRPGVVDDWPDWDSPFTDLDVSVKIKTRSTKDDPSNPSATWTDWADFVIGDYTARGIQRKLIVDTTDPTHQVYIQELSTTVDMTDRVQAGEDITISSSGTFIEFGSPFAIVPAIGITIQNGQTGDYYEFTIKTKDGFEIVIKNSSGTAVERSIDYIAKGY